jgi:hypothetical protein
MTPSRQAVKRHRPGQVVELPDQHHIQRELPVETKGLKTSVGAHTADDIKTQLGENIPLMKARRRKD